MTGRSCGSLLEWFLHRGEQSPDRSALWIPDGPRFRTLTWGQWLDDVLRAAAVLEAWGVRPGDRVAQLAENRYEWLVADLALQCVRAIHVPLHAPLAAQQVAREIAHCGARFVLVSTTAQLAKLATAWKTDGETPSARNSALRVMMYDAPGESPLDWGSCEFAFWNDAVAQADSGQGGRLARQAVAAARPHDLLKILYTSGTTGESKGVMLTQENLRSNAQALAFAYGQRPHERKLNFLALSHVFAQTNDFYSTLVAGCELGLARSRDSVLDDCRHVQPTFLNGVPSFYQRVHQALVRAGRQHAPDAVRELLGGRLELCNAGGAPLPEFLHEYFASQGIPLLQGYGLTETSPVISVSTPSADRRGCVGRPLADVEVRIAADGEVLTRGPHVSPGYYRDESATAAALVDGWFHTGDLGELDADGFLRITGRKKEMIVLANGRNVPPLAIEAALLADPLFQQAVVFGDGRTDLVALVQLNDAELRHALSAATADSWRSLVAQRINQALRGRAAWEQIRRFAVLPEPLSVERGELTAKLSLRRAVIRANYQGLLGSLDATGGLDGGHLAENNRGGR